MTDVLKIGKKAFTVSVVITTILWSIGVAAFVAPLVATAVDVTLTAGDVIKGASTKNVFYYSADGKRYTFPSDKVYFSYYKDWTVVKTIPDSQLGNITIGGTLPYRAGTQLVKIQTDPKVYAVEPGGALRWIETEAIATSLYGSLWAKKVHDVGPEIFPYVYTVGASVNTATYPAGSLVKSGADVYYIESATSKKKVTADGLTANRFFDKYVVTTSLDLSGYVAGAEIAAVVPALTTLVGAAPVVVGTTPTTPAGTGITVALDSVQPLATTIVSDTVLGAQAMIPVLKLVFTAPADGDVKVTGVTLKRGGISADTDIGNMYLYDGETKLAGSPSIASALIAFTNSSGLFTVTKGTAKTVTVKLDLKNAVTSGKTITFSVNAATDVTLGSGTVSGTFPLAGNSFTTASITDLGNLVFANVTPAAAGTVDPGTTGFEFWRFSATNSDQDVEIRKLNFTIVGSINVGDLKNFSLWAGATQLGSTVVDMASDKTVTFDLTSAPYVVTKGQVKNLSLKADILTGTTRTFRASFQNSSDIVTYDKGYNVFLKANGLDSYTLIQPVDATPAAVNYTINSGTLTQTLATDSPTGNIPDGSTNVVFAKFSWKANGEDVKVSSLSVSSTCSGTCTANADELSNVRLLVNGSQVGTTIASLETMGVADTTWGTFGNSFIVKAGTSAEVKVIGDTTDSDITAAGEVYTVGLVAMTANAQGTVSLTSINTVAQNANSLTVKGGQVTVSKNAAFGDKTAANPTGPVNATGAKVASFTLTAGSGESIDISQIQLTETAGTCIGTYMQNLTLKNAAGTQLGTTYANPSTSCTTAANTYTFNVSPAVVIAAGAQYVVDVFADLKASLAATSLIQVAASGVVATGHDTGTSATMAATAVALQNQVISGSGAFLLALDADAPVANNYLLGATDQIIAKFKITASSTEAVNITQLIVSGFFPTAASTGTWSNIRLYDSDLGTQIGSAIASFSTAGITATSTFSHAVFSGLTLQIPKGVAKVINIKADAATYEALGLSATGQAPAVMVMRSYQNASGSNPITATGASSGSSLTAVIDQTGSNWGTGNTWSPGAYGATTTMYRAKLTTAWATDTPSGASSPSAAQTIAKFVVTNLANAGAYVATVEFLNFNLSTTISQNAAIDTDRYLTLYKDSLATTALGTTPFLDHEKFGTTHIIDGTITNVDISSGASKTFYATLDTTDAASTETLSVRIPANGISWTDGVQTPLTVMGADLPLVYKTFTY